MAYYFQRPPTQIPKKDEHLWDFVGTEALVKSDVTKLHIRTVYNLRLNEARPLCANNTFSSSFNKDADVEGDEDEVKVIPSDKIVETPKGKRKPRVKISCKRACKDNPNCLNWLGQERWEASDAFDAFCLRHGLPVQDSPLDEKRDPTLPVGLRNLGATCYLNTLLQVWYHNLAFRCGIYNYTPKSQAVSDNIVSHLQSVFGYLQLGAKGIFNPVDFVDSMNLKKGEQQDAQEFCKLFSSLLEQQISGSDPNAKGMVREQFEGSYTYQTQCSNCGYTSKRSCTFQELELNLMDNSTLDDCLATYLEEENLMTDNQYFCERCQSKQDAKRSVILDTLPPVIQFQLLRFVWDLKTGTKKKVKGIIQFTSTLNMAKFVGTPAQRESEEAQEEKDEMIYELTAVLMHKGLSAYSGHYIAQIWDHERQKWFNLDDETSTVISEKSSIHLGEGEDKDNEDVFDKTSAPEKKSSKKSTKTGKKPKRHESLAEGTIPKSDPLISSRNAYMLTYLQRKTRKQLMNRLATKQLHLEPPTHVQEKLIILDAKFGSDILEYEASKQLLRQDFDKKLEERREVYNIWNLQNLNQESYYVPRRWITKWLMTDFEVDDDLDHADSKDPKTSFSDSAEKRSDEVLIADQAESEIYDPESMNWESVPPAPIHGEPCSDLVKGEKDRSTAAGKKRDKSVVSDSSLDPRVVDCSRIMCAHGKLDLLQLGSVKRISLDAALILTSKYDYNFLPVAMTNSDDFLCRACVEAVFETKAGKRSHREHVELLTKFEKEYIAREKAMEKRGLTLNEIRERLEGYWISRDWFAEFRKMSSKLVTGTQLEIPSPDSEPYRGVVICPHGNLSLDESRRKIIGPETFQLLQSIIPAWKKTFDNDARICQTCVAKHELHLEVTRDLWDAADIQKSLLRNLFNRRADKNSFNESLYVIPNAFLTAWRNFIMTPDVDPKPISLNNQIFVCHDHGKFLYDVNNQDELKAAKLDVEAGFSLVPKADWTNLSDLYPSGPTISVSKIHASMDVNDLSSDPPVCEDCRSKRLMDYGAARIFIRRAQKDTKKSDVIEILDDDKGMSSSDELDPGHNEDFVVIGKAISNEPRNSSQSKHVSVSPLPSSTRKPRMTSERRRKTTVLEITRGTRVLDLKVMIYESLGFSPIHQRLYFNDVEILNDSTMGDLYVTPNSIITLEVLDDDLSIMNSENPLVRRRSVELGFHGTSLVGFEAPSNDIITDKTGERSREVLQTKSPVKELLGDDMAIDEGCALQAALLQSRLGFKYPIDDADEDLALQRALNLSMLETSNPVFNEEETLIFKKAQFHDNINVGNDDGKVDEPMSEEVALSSNSAVLKQQEDASVHNVFPFDIEILEENERKTVVQSQKQSLHTFKVQATRASRSQQAAKVTRADVRPTKIKQERKKSADVVLLSDDSQANETGFDSELEGVLRIRKVYVKSKSARAPSTRKRRAQTTDIDCKSDSDKSLQKDSEFLSATRRRRRLNSQPHFKNETGMDELEQQELELAIQLSLKE